MLAWLADAAGAEAAAQPGLRRGPVARRTRAGTVRRAARRPARRRRDDPRHDPVPLHADQRGRPAGDADPGVRDARATDRSRCSRSGASAGLCLYPDRYSYAWRTDDGTRHDLGPGPRWSARPRQLRRHRSGCPRSPGGAVWTSTRSTSPTPARWPGWPTWSGPSTTRAASGCWPRSRSPAPTRRRAGRGPARGAAAAGRRGGAARRGRGVPQRRDRLPDRAPTGAASTT